MFDSGNRDCVGQVAEVTEEAVFIQFKAPSFCQAKGGCRCADGMKSFWAPKTWPAIVGESVKLSVRSNTIWYAVFWSYLLPLLLCIVGAGVGSVISETLGSIVGACLGLLCGLIILRQVNKQIRSPLFSLTPLLEKDEAENGKG